MNDAKYKVLWIDDQPELVEGYQFWAGLRNIELIHRESWADAIPVLEKDFNELTAIILDANCKFNTSDKSLDERFLSDVLQQLIGMFSDQKRFIPWYILSAGTMSNFSFITNMVISRERRELEKDWGATIYLKTDFENQGENSPLFDNIRRVGDSQSNNSVLYRHREVFKYMGTDALIGVDARRIMLKALAVLYYPEENINYEFAGNPIRKVVEYMFKAAHKNGLLTDDFLDKKGFIIIWDSMQYLCGMEPTNIPFRFGRKGTKKDYSDNEGVLPTTCYNTFRGLLNYVNVDSHIIGEEDDSPYKIDAESKDLFFSYVLFLCHIITCFGKYVEQHPNIEENKAKCTAIQGKKNAELTPVAEKRVIEFVKRETRDDIIGHECNVLNSDTGKYAGPCKLSSGLEVNLGRRIRIEDIEPNTGKDSKIFPFIATRITVLD